MRGFVCSFVSFEDDDEIAEAQKKLADKEQELVVCDANIEQYEAAVKEWKDEKMAVKKEITYWNKE